MSIKLIAKELYRLEQEVDKIEKELAAAQNAHKDDQELKDRLRKAKAERNRLKNTLEGAKEEPKCRVPR